MASHLLFLRGKGGCPPCCNQKAQSMPTMSIFHCVLDEEIIGENYKLIHPGPDSQENWLIIGSLVYCSTGLGVSTNGILREGSLSNTTFAEQVDYCQLPQRLCHGRIIPPMTGEQLRVVPQNRANYADDSKIKKIKNLKFKDKVKQRVYIGFFKGAEIIYMYFMLRSLLH